MNKEVLDRIVKEAEIDVDKAPINYMNEEAYAWKFGYETGYIAGRTVGIDRIAELEEALSEVIKTVELLYEHIGAEGNINTDNSYHKAKQLLTK